MYRLHFILAILLVTPFATAQQAGGQASGTSSEGGSSGARNPADDLTAIAPPFDVDDILRMHRVGLQDEVIINALKARFHSMELTPQDLQVLRKHSVSESIIAVMQNPANSGHDTLIPPHDDGSPVATGADPANGAAKSVSVVADGVPANGSSGPTAGVNGAPGSIPQGTPAANGAPGSIPPGTNATGVSNPPPADQEIAKNAAPQYGLPQEPGVYRKVEGSGWEKVTTEKVQWSHDEDSPTKNIHGQLQGQMSGTITRAAQSDFLIVTPRRMSIVQYQLLKLKVNKGVRTFQPGVGGHPFGGLATPETVPYIPERISPTVWLVSLDKPAQGEYGFLTPQNAVLHSSTGLDDQLYTFHVF